MTINASDRHTARAATALVRLRRQAATALLATLLGMGTSAWAQADALLTKRQAPLRQGPSETSELLATLPAQAPLTRLPERQGPWTRVKTEGGQTGWVHMFDLGAGTSAAAVNSGGSAGGNALRGIANLFNRNPAPATTATSTIGIRGLGAEDIANSQPNLQSLSKAEAFRSDEAQARRFAADAQLVARPVDPLPAPEAPAAPVGKGAGSSF